MHDEPRQQLCQLIAQYGCSLSEDPRRCGALLKDHCGQYKREIFVLVNALENRVATELLNASAGVPEAILLSRLSKRLEDELGLAETAAKWAVETWALALGVISQPLPVVAPATHLSKPSEKIPLPVKQTSISRKRSDSVVTTIVTHYDVGFGSNLYIRGEGAGLCWDVGVLMKNVENDVWIWTTNEMIEGVISCKFLVNDSTDNCSTGDSMIASVGETTTFYPSF